MWTCWAGPCQPILRYGIDWPWKTVVEVRHGMFWGGWRDHSSWIHRSNSILISWEVFTVPAIYKPISWRITLSGYNLLMFHATLGDTEQVCVSYENCACVHALLPATLPFMSEQKSEQSTTWKKKQGLVMASSHIRHIHSLCKLHLCNYNPQFHNTESVALIAFCVIVLPFFGCLSFTERDNGNFVLTICTKQTIQNHSISLWSFRYMCVAV